MNRVQVTEKRITIPTYIPAEPETLPMFAENRVHQRSSGNPYPNPIVNTVRHDIKVEKEYDCIVIENDYLYLEILPEIGGRIFTARDKSNGYDFFYRQHVIKPALIGMLGLWISGGVEFNWPIHHRPSTYLPVDSFIENHPDGSVTVWVGEHEPLDRMKGMVGIHLKPDAALFETKVRIFNRTDLPHSFLWWENAAVPVNEQYRIFFPPDVQSVNFHYKKATGAYPVMDEYFNTQDNRGGNDIRFHKNTRQATSYFSGPSKFDFFGGYDESKQAGVIHYASHHTSVGKKMFTWGYHTLSKAWEAALTDDDGAYAELMASSYSDNQPDFTWIEPFEVKEFSQSWYPYKEIGEVQQANDILALSIQNQQIGLYPVTTRSNLHLAVYGKDTILYEADLTLHATKPVCITIPSLEGFTEIRITDPASTILSYKPVGPSSASAVPEPQPDYPLPCDITSAESSFQTGLHVAQYRDPIREPDLYWKRALELDTHHYPSLVGLSWYSLLRLRINDAEKYGRLALQEQNRLNTNPPSSRALYFLGLSLKYGGKLDQAKEYLHKGLWTQSGIAACSLLLAQIACMNTSYEEGLAIIRHAERYGTYNQKSQQLKVSLLRHTGNLKAARDSVAVLLEEDPLDYYALNEARLLGLEASRIVRRTNQTQMLLDVVSDYLDAGLKEEALLLLENADSANAMVSYMRFLCNGQFSKQDETYCFPSRRWELIALLKATKQMPELSQAFLLLGSIQFGIQRDYTSALNSWEHAGTSAQALRNKAAAIFKSDIRDPRVPHLLLQALDKEPDHLQLCYEYLRVLELTEAPVSTRTEAFEHIGENTKKRDDLFLLGVHAYNQASQFEKALSLLVSHQFVPCEGGEHAVANEYLLAHLGLALKAMNEGDWKSVLSQLEQNFHLPSNLGGGVWHQVMLSPYHYLTGLCKEQIESGKGRDDFEAVYDFPINYFTTMYLPAFPIYKALASRQLGYHEEAVTLLQSSIQTFKNALRKPVYGYFAATPFFETFIEDPKTARDVFYTHLLSFSMAANHETSSAILLCEELIRFHPSHIRSYLLRDFLKAGEMHDIVY
ncbi:hypothetical protein DSECCO2_353100 [anaerobic digester metagenome]